MYKFILGRDACRDFLWRRRACIDGVPWVVLRFNPKETDEWAFDFFDSGEKMIEGISRRKGRGAAHDGARKTPQI